MLRWLAWRNSLARRVPPVADIPPGSGEHSLSAVTLEGERLKIRMPHDADADGTGTAAVCIGQTAEKAPRTVVVKVLGILGHTRKKLLIRSLLDAARIAHGHPGILPFLATTKIGGQRALVSLYMSNGNLLEHLKLGRGSDRKRHVLEVGDAVDYLHNEAGCVHGNIKCANVLISDNGHALLADLGLNTVADAHLSSERSVRVTAPELFRPTVSTSPRPSHTFETDVYAFGMLVLEMNTERPPWSGFSDSEVIRQRVCSGEHPVRPRGGAFVSTSHSLWDVCRSCWRADPAERPAIKTILERLTDIEFEPVRVIQEHSSPAFSVAYTPQGHRIVSGSLDGSIWMWDSGSGRRVAGPMLGQDGSTHVAVSPDGHQILSVGGRTIRRWDAESRAPIGAATDCISGAALCIACSPDGARIAFGETDGPLRVWETAMTPGALRAVTHEEYTVWSPCVAFSPDGASFAFAAPDGAVLICDSATCTVVSSLVDDGAQVHAVCFSPDGAHIVLGSQDHALRIHNVATQQLVHILRGHSDMVLSVAYSPSGKHIASGSNDGTVRIWDAESGCPIGAPLDGHQELITRSAFGEREVIRSQESIRSVSWSPDGRSLASAPHGFNLQEIRIWDLFD